jgi:hypothetical protein
MLLLKLALLLLLFAINLAAPGLLLLRRLRWPAAEKFCAAIALSQFIAFLLSFAIYLLHLSNGWYWIVTGISVASLLLVRRDVARLLRNHHVRAQLKTYLVLYIVAFCMLAMIRHYSGGIWAGDWLEHYQRTIFFLNHQPASQLFLDQYTLPARPPMMNVLAAAYLAQIGEHSFAAYQLIFLLLNLLVVMPCVLLLPMLAAERIRAGAIAVLIFLLATNPMLLQNVTYTWTKLFTAFYMLLALRFYLRGWRKNDSTRIIAAFVALAIAMLVHYSAGPYIVVIGLHYVLQFFRRREKRWGELVVSLLAGVIVLLPWVAWSMHTYGVHETVASNTSVTDVAAAKETSLARISANIYDTIIPIQWRVPESSWLNFTQQRRLGFLRDYMFSLYQHNILLGMGILGGVVIAVMVGQVLVGRQLPHRLVLFWRWFVLGAVILGIAVVGMRVEIGVAQACLPALMLLGLTFLAARWGRLNRGVRAIVIVAALVDFTLGVVLQMYVEHFDFTASAALNHRAMGSWYLKQTNGLVFLGDGLAKAVYLLLSIQIVSILWLLIRVITRRAGEDNPAPRAPR